MEAQIDLVRKIQQLQVLQSEAAAREVASAIREATLDGYAIHLTIEGEDFVIASSGFLHDGDWFSFSSKPNATNAYLACRLSAIETSSLALVNG